MKGVENKLRVKAITIPEYTRIIRLSGDERQLVPFTTLTPKANFVLLFSFMLKNDEDNFLVSKTILKTKLNNNYVVNI